MKQFISNTGKLILKKRKILTKQANRLYKKYKNYCKVGRILRISESTVRGYLLAKVRQQRKKCEKKRGNTYYQTYYKFNKKARKQGIIRTKKWYKKNKNHVRKRMKIWYKKKGGYKICSDSQRIHVQHRRALKKKIRELYSKKDLAYTRSLFRNKCAVCGSKKFIQIDHWYPLSKGHALTRKNAVLLCRACNYYKHTNYPNDVFSKKIVNRIEKKLNN